MAVTGAGLEGIVAAESQICYIDGDAGILCYQGYNIHTLAEHATFEEVIYLLWNGRLPKQAELDQLKKALVANREIRQEVEAFLKSNGKSTPMDVLRTAVSMLSLYDPQAKDMSPEANQREGRQADGADGHHRHHFDRLRNGKEVVAGDPKLGIAANFLYTLTGKKPDDVMERVFDIALTLHADHELNASTFAARVVGGDAFGYLFGGDRRHRRAEGAAARRRQRRRDQDAARSGHGGQSDRTCQTNAGEQRSRSRASAIACITPIDPRATHLARLSEELGKRTGHVESVSDVKQDREVHEGNQESERECRFLFGIHVLFAGDSDRSVHADLRGQPHVGLDGARAGAISQQPADSSARGLHGRAGWSRVGCYRGAVNTGFTQ